MSELGDWRSSDRVLGYQIIKISGIRGAGFDVAVVGCDQLLIAPFSCFYSCHRDLGFSPFEEDRLIQPLFDYFHISIINSNGGGWKSRRGDLELT